MGEAKERSDWNRAAVLTAKVHNMHQVKQGDCIDFKDVHPFFISQQLPEHTEEFVESQLGELKRDLGGYNGSSR